MTKWKNGKWLLAAEFRLNSVGWFVVKNTTLDESIRWNRGSSLYIARLDDVVCLVGYVQGLYKSAAAHSFPPRHSIESHVRRAPLCSMLFVATSHKGEAGEHRSYRGGGARLPALTKWCEEKPHGRCRRWGCMDDEPLRRDFDFTQQACRQTCHALTNSLQRGRKFENSVVRDRGGECMCSVLPRCVQPPMIHDYPLGDAHSFWKRKLFCRGFLSFRGNKQLELCTRESTSFLWINHNFFPQTSLVFQQKVQFSCNKDASLPRWLGILDGFWNGTLLDKRWNHSIRHNSQGCRWSNKEFSIASGWLQLVLWKILEQLFSLWLLFIQCRHQSIRARHNNNKFIVDDTDAKKEKGKERIIWL